MSYESHFNIWAVILVFITSVGYLIASSFSASSDNLDKKVNENAFTNDVLTVINSAEDMFMEISIGDGYSKYLATGDNNTYVGMCVTLKGLVENGYLRMDINKNNGLFLVEAPFDGGKTKYMAWFHNDSFAFNGIEKMNVSKNSISNNITDVESFINKYNYTDKIQITSDVSKGGTGETYSIQCINENIG